MGQSLLIPSAGVLLYVNGRLVGRVSSFEWESDTPRKFLRTIDDLFSPEIVPTGIQVSGRIGLYRTMGDGGAQGAGLVTRHSDIPRERYCSILLVQRRLDLPLFYATMCQTTSEGWGAPNKGIVTGSLSFQGVTFTNEFDAKVV